MALIRCNSPQISAPKRQVTAPFCMFVALLLYRVVHVTLCIGKDHLVDGKLDWLSSCVVQVEEMKHCPFGEVFWCWGPCFLIPFVSTFDHCLLYPNSPTILGNYLGSSQWAFNNCLFSMLFTCCYETIYISSKKDCTYYKLEMVCRFVTTSVSHGSSSGSMASWSLSAAQNQIL